VCWFPPIQFFTALQAHNVLCCCRCSCKRGTYTQLLLSATHMNATPL